MYIEKVKEQIEKYKIDLSSYPWQEGEIKGCSKNQVYYLQKKLGLKLPKAYKEYLLNFGYNTGKLRYLLLNYKELLIHRDFLLECKILPKNAIILFYDRESNYIIFIKSSEGDNPIVYNGFIGEYFSGGDDYHLEPSDTLIDFLIKKNKLLAYDEKKLYLSPLENTLHTLSIHRNDEIFSVANSFNDEYNNPIFYEIPEILFFLEILNN